MDEKMTSEITLQLIYVWILVFLWTAQGKGGFCFSFSLKIDSLKQILAAGNKEVVYVPL